MSDDSAADYLARWRDASAHHALAWRFLRPHERIGWCGLAALEQEWLKATRDVSEAQLAAAKLGWWREEMQRAGQGEARHPLVRALFAEPRIRSVPQACWSAAVDAALLAASPPPPADFAAQRAAARPLAAAFAALETRVAFGADVDCTRATALNVLGHLVADLRALPVEVRHARSPLPMNLLARHGLIVEDLARDGPARRAAVRDHAAALQRALAEAVTMDGPLTFLQRVALQDDERSLRAALRDADPLHGLQAVRGGLRDLLKIWRAARMSRHDPRIENADATK